jgi:plastocyanin
MAQIFTHQGGRCLEHPHRGAWGRCTHCSQPFCESCLSAGPRAADGTRGWFCTRCRATLASAARLRREARSWGGRVRRYRGRVLLGALAATLVAATAGASLLLAGRLQQPTAGGAALPAGGAVTCGELTRIQSVATIGVPAASDAVDLLKYPFRAAVTVSGDEAPAGQAGQAGNGGPPAALVDDCDSGWRAPAGGTPALLLEPQRAGTAYIHRLALWQDPEAPRAAWVREFQVLASPSAAGDDFVPLRLDREPVLSAAPGPQWFRVVQPAPAGPASFPLPAQERVRYGQPFPDVAPARRLLLRLVTTYGPPAEGAALGEVAAFGPDLEVRIGDAKDSGDNWTGQYLFEPPELRALAGRPLALMLVNESRHPHVFTTWRQDRNVEVRLEPGQVTTTQLVAASQAGPYHFYCAVRGHDRLGLLGTLVVR